MLKPTSIDELHSLAENAAHLARIIRQWLPVTSDTEAKAASWRTAERWFYQAAEHFTACERIRNPHKLPFENRVDPAKTQRARAVRGGSYHGPSGCSAAWFELSEALDAIAVVYRLEPVADESGIPHLPFQQAVPVIESGILRRLELAASEILEAVRDEGPLDTPVVQPVERESSQAEKQYAKATDPVPEGYKEQGQFCGPLEGNKTALARVITRNPKAKPQDLLKHHGGKVFVRELRDRKVEAFFRTLREYHDARARLTSGNSE